MVRVMEEYKKWLGLFMITMSVAMDSNATDGISRDANSTDTQWSFAGGYSRISTEGGKFGASYVSLGYRWQLADDLSLIPLL